MGYEEHVEYQGTGIKRLIDDALRTQGIRTKFDDSAYQSYIREGLKYRIGPLAGKKGVSSQRLTGRKDKSSDKGYHKAISNRLPGR